MEGEITEGFGKVSEVDSPSMRGKLLVKEVQRGGGGPLKREAEGMSSQTWVRVA